MIPAFTDALVRELGAWSPVMAGRSVETVFFGGGTPSLLPLNALARIMQVVRDRFTLKPNTEITLEANPGTVDQRYLAGLREAGINRLSIGVQSLDDGELVMLDRIHNARAALDAYTAARAAGFDNVNMDLMYGLAGQSLSGWQATLCRATELRPEHLSLYALTIEEGTGLAAQIARGAAPEPDPDTQAALYEYTQDAMADAGYDHYEISNWSLPGRACAHNLTYWQDGDWLGLGPGAHSHLDGRRFSVVRSPAQYIDRVQAIATVGPMDDTDRTDDRTSPIESSEVARLNLAVRFPQIDMVEEPSQHTQRADAAMMALRLTRGLDAAAFANRFGVTPDQAFPGALTESALLGLIEWHGEQVRLTRTGRLLSNEVFVRLLAAST